MSEEQNAASAPDVAEAGPSGGPWKVTLPVWSGPLDLLLDLIQANQLDIRDIPISEITKQYLAAMELMKDLELETTSEFLVMAATLIWIKSRILLPAELATIDEGFYGEDPRQGLVRQLLEYQKFKELASKLNELEGKALGVAERSAVAAPPPAPRPAEDPWVEVGMAELLQAFRDLVRVLDFEEFGVLREIDVRVEDQMERLRALLADRETILFSEVLPEIPRKVDVIGLFWALLELYKTREISLWQQERFGEIRIGRGPDFGRDETDEIPDAISSPV